MAKGVKTGGRSKGTPNKTTKALKDMILEALENKGGVKYLEEQASANPSAFMTLIGKVLPMEIKNPEGEEFKVAMITRRIVRPANE